MEFRLLSQFLLRKSVNCPPKLKYRFYSDPSTLVVIMQAFQTKLIKFAIVYTSKKNRKKYRVALDYYDLHFVDLDNLKRERKRKGTKKIPTNFEVLLFFFFILIVLGLGNGLILCSIRFILFETAFETLLYRIFYFVIWRNPAVSLWEIFKLLLKLDPMSILTKKKSRLQHCFVKFQLSDTQLSLSNSVLIREGTRDRKHFI